MGNDDDNEYKMHRQETLITYSFALRNTAVSKGFSLDKSEKLQNGTVIIKNIN